MRFTVRLLAALALFLALPLIVSALAFGDLTRTAPTTPTPHPKPTSGATAASTESAQERTIHPRAEALYLAGLAAYQAGDYATAVAKFQEAVTLAPNEANWHNSLGLGLTRLDRYEEAIAEYNMAIALDSGLADEAHYNLGVIFQAQGEADRAAMEYQVAIAARPDFALAYNNLGTAYSDLGRSDEALDAYATATSLDPVLAAAHLNLGMAYAERGDLERAAGELEIVVQLEPQSETASFDLGLVRARQGKPALARAAFERVIAMAPASKWAGLARAQLEQLKP